MLKWSDQILEELNRALTSDMGISAGKVDALIATMKNHFPSANVQGYTALVEAMPNHKKDRHVLAAAVCSQARLIVTFNLRHFPRRLTEPFGIEAQPPDAFLSHLLRRAPQNMLAILNAQAHELRHPHKTRKELLKTLERSTPRFAKSAEELITSDLDFVHFWRRYTA